MAPGGLILAEGEVCLSELMAKPTLAAIANHVQAGPFCAAFVVKAPDPRGAKWRFGLLDPSASSDGRELCDDTSRRNHKNLPWGQMNRPPLSVLMLYYVNIQAVKIKMQII